MKKWCLASWVVFATLAASAEILGTKPRYLGEFAASFANDQAVSRRIWMPGLDEGYVPQGLTIADGGLLVAAYRSADPKVNTGPCRVFRVDPATGKETGAFDAPAGCGHAGGLAYLGAGMLVLADTRQLWRIDLATAFSDGDARRALRGTVKLGGALRGSFAGAEKGSLWIGTWTKEAAQAKMYRLDPHIFDESDGEVITEARALETLPIPVEIQGLAFDAGGRIWLSMSNSREGLLYCLERKTVTVLARHETVNGIEDIEFDAAGRLWAVSEAGAKKYLSWPRHFPVIFEIDVAKLR